MKTATARTAMAVAVIAVVAIGIARGYEQELQIDLPANFHASSDTSL